jgi:sugar phosphate isomerase/epimerase
MIPVVADGDVDMARYLSVLAASGYKGPLVFENPPHVDALEYLSESFDYIRGLLGKQGKAAL